MRPWELCTSKVSVFLYDCSVSLLLYTSQSSVYKKMLFSVLFSCIIKFEKLKVCGLADARETAERGRYAARQP